MDEFKTERERLVKELKSEFTKIDSKEMTPACLDSIYKLIVAIEKLDKIKVLAGGDDDYSEAGSNRRSMYSGRRTYYSRHDRMSQLEEELERLMDNAPNERVREALERAMNEMR